MDHEERRGRVQQFLDDLRAQRDVDVREALMELTHLVFELDDEARRLSERISQLEVGGGASDPIP